MKCLQCGWCCKNLWVIIVNDPEKCPAIQEDNLMEHNGLGQRCKHLRGDKIGECKCAVHNKPWYSSTPCYQYTQIENSPDAPCRRGEHELKKSAIST